MIGQADAWPAGGAGVLTLPSGRRVRGRGLRHALPTGTMPGGTTPDGTTPTGTTPDAAGADRARPQFGLYCLGTPPPAFPWPSRWIRWPDFRLPADRADALDALAEAWRRSAGERVEVACGGGRGRTGTALACLAVLDGAAAIAHVRAQYHRRAVETPWQARFVRRFALERRTGGPGAQG